MTSILTSVAMGSGPCGQTTSQRKSKLSPQGLRCTLVSLLCKIIIWLNNLEVWIIILGCLMIALQHFQSLCELPFMLFTVLVPLRLEVQHCRFTWSPEIAWWLRFGFCFVLWQHLILGESWWERAKAWISIPSFLFSVVDLMILYYELFRESKQRDFRMWGTVLRVLDPLHFQIEALRFWWQLWTEWKISTAEICRSNFKIT